jgi:hypothetical protein
MKNIMKRDIKILAAILSMYLSSVSYADYLDDWPDEALCSWIEQESPPEYIVDEALNRGLECVPKSLIKATEIESKIKIYDVNFSQPVLDILLSKGIGKTDFDFSIYKIVKSHEKLQCFFRLRRVVYENKDEGEIENWNIADGYLLIEKGVVNIDGNRSRWRMGGLSYDPSYLEDEVNLKLTKDGHFVGKMAYFTHYIDTGEVPRSPLYIEFKKHKKSKPLSYKNPQKKGVELWIDVEEWAGGVLFLSKCRIE